MRVYSTKPIIGHRFGRLTVIDRSPQKNTYNRMAYWICLCDCGAFKSIQRGNLMKGSTKSCGCWMKELLRARFRRHGAGDTPEYRAWTSMRTRCTNPRNAGYANYGARGITVCPEWDSFEQFLTDMGPRPSPLHSIDRINNDLGYSAANCRWATKQEQARNRRIPDPSSYPRARAAHR